MCPRKHFVAARRLENRVEVLGQIDAPQDMAEYIGLCQLQTIEPLFRKYLPKGGQILEAGCGRGRWVLYLRGLGYDVAGIDLADSDLAAARAIDPSAPVERGDVLQAPFPDSSFDAVISLGVVEHFEGGPRQALAEVRRLLKPQGLFLVTVPTQNLVRYLVVDPIRTAVNLLRRLSGVHWRSASTAIRAPSSAASCGSRSSPLSRPRRTTSGRRRTWACMPICRRCDGKAASGN